LPPHVACTVVARSAAEYVAVVIVVVAVVAVVVVVVVVVTFGQPRVLGNFWQYTLTVVPSAHDKHDAVCAWQHNWGQPAVPGCSSQYCCTLTPFAHERQEAVIAMQHIVLLVQMLCFE
jgi:hypothetical protein